MRTNREQTMNKLKEQTVNKPGTHIREQRMIMDMGTNHE